MQFFFLGGIWLNTDQARAWREEQTRLSQIFCEWCVSKAVKHSKDCRTKEEGFDPSVTPKLTQEEREKLIAQKNEARH